MLAADLNSVVRGLLIEESGAPARGLVLAEVYGGPRPQLTKHGDIVTNGRHLPIDRALGNCPNLAVAVTERSLEQSDVAAAECPIHLVEPCATLAERVGEMEDMVAPLHPFGSRDELPGHHVNVVEQVVAGHQE